MPFRKICFSQTQCASAETQVIVLSNRVSGCSGSAAAGNKSATRPPFPPPGCGGEWKETGRNRWVGIRAV